MVPKPIKLATVIAAVSLVLIIEMVAWWTLQHIPTLAVVGMARLVQISAILALVFRMEGGMGAIGLAPGSWRSGLKAGALWSMGFALVAGLGMGALLMAGQNPMALLRTPLPHPLIELILFFVVGGIIAPIAEELCFRGLLYTYFRRWGILLALIASTTIFVALHAVKGVPYPQIVGGVVFALAYEISGSLAASITIHTLGNLAIFTLALVA